jgi:hypothetical protein
VSAQAQALFAEEEEAQEGRLQDEGEHPFQGQALADDSAGEFGKPGPVGAELELHQDAGHHSHGEVEPEDARPEAGHLVVTLVRRPEGQNLEDHDEQGQPHGQLREQVVVGDREGKLNAMPHQVRAHRLPLPSSGCISLPGQQPYCQGRPSPRLRYG